jgi:hypothetical protein
MKDTLPMEATGVQHLIDRTYRESGKFQWAREVLINAFEAKATKVEFGIEFQAVASKGVYRRYIADNGCGMTAEQLSTFFNTFGGGGKEIGGTHQNFGLGAKTSLLPWNKFGFVVMSWVEGKAAMIWARQDPKTGQYGLRLFKVVSKGGEAATTAVVAPFNDPNTGCDFAKIKPDWIKAHGTVVILMGDDPRDDTVTGDPNRDEGDLKGLASYLNRRVWEIPEGVEVKVEELRNSDSKTWPKSEKEARSNGEGRIHTRTILGAKSYINYASPTFSKGAVAKNGTLNLADGTKLHWFLWKGERPQIGNYAPNVGFIGALYRNELYDASSHISIYRQFGVTDPSVRQKLWIIAEPMAFDAKSKVGVYPRTDRNSLLIQQKTDAAEALPFHTWGAEFAESMPEVIKDALRAAHLTEGSIEDESWRQRLADRFGRRWRVPRAKQSTVVTGFTVLGVQGLGGISRAPKHETDTPRTFVEPADEGEAQKVDPTGPAPGMATGPNPGTTKAEMVDMDVSIPTYRVVRATEIEPGYMAAWAPNDVDHPEGVVLINIDHPVLQEQIKHWQAQYADHLAEGVEREIISTYGEIAVAKIAHSEKLKGLLPASIVDKELRSEAALTMALLGLMAEEALIAHKLSARMGKKILPKHAKSANMSPVATA